MRSTNAQERAQSAVRSERDSDLMQGVHSIELACGRNYRVALACDRQFACAAVHLVLDQIIKGQEARFV